jgi:hypothetical protein
MTIISFFVTGHLVYSVSEDFGRIASSEKWYRDAAKYSFTSPWSLVATDKVHLTDITLKKNGTQPEIVRVP